MPLIVSKLLLSFATVVGAPILYTIVFLILERRMNDVAALIIATAIVGPMSVIAWVALWRNNIIWTRRRSLRTVLALVASFALSGLAVPVATWFNYAGRNRSGVSEVGIVVGGMLFFLLWLVSSILAWQETKEERRCRLSASSRGDLPCPNCEYNLTGLREATCPECGTQYTIDELVASLADADIASKLHD